jgi:hypothetical protein
MGLIIKNRIPKSFRRERTRSDAIHSFILADPLHPPSTKECESGGSRNEFCYGWRMDVHELIARENTLSRLVEREQKLARMAEREKNRWRGTSVCAG